MDKVRYGVLDSLIGYTLRRAQLKVFDDFTESLADWQMTPQRFSSLVFIVENPGLKLSELAELLHVARSNTVVLVDALVALGYVERHASPTDRRALELQATREGKRALRKMLPPVRAHDRRIVKALARDERQLLKQMLERILEV
ncbi:MAG: MarR family transcriptional regulator [Polyangiales bacterium]